MKNLPTEWSYCQGREYGHTWAGLGPPAVEIAELVEWSNYECWGRMPFQDFAHMFIEETQESAVKEWEEFPLDAFFRGFVEGVRDFRKSIAEFLAKKNNQVGHQHPNYVPLY